jgi:hypothetical protein
MKRIAHSRNSIPVLAEVEPDDRTRVLEDDSKAEYLRVETDGSIEICHVEVDVGNIDWLDRTRVTRKGLRRCYQPSRG